MAIFLKVSAVPNDHKGCSELQQLQVTEVVFNSAVGRPSGTGKVWCLSKP